MTCLELLDWARKGLAAEKARWREIQNAFISGGKDRAAYKVQSKIDAIEVKEQSLDDLEEIHNRRY